MSTPDFFRSRLDQMIDLRHPLAVLATRLPWASIEAAVVPKLAHQAKPAKRLAGIDLAGAFEGEFGGGISPAGRPRLPVRLMVSLLYLKNGFNLSDEELVERWAENVQWQFFGGMDYYEPRLPCDATQIGRFRRLLGEDGLEQLFKATIECAVDIKAVRPADLERVIVDSTVQSKAIAHPVDSRLLEVAWRDFSTMRGPPTWARKSLIANSHSSTWASPSITGWSSLARTSLPGNWAKPDMGGLRSVQVIRIDGACAGGNLLQPLGFLGFARMGRIDDGADPRARQYHHAIGVAHRQVAGRNGDFTDQHRMVDPADRAKVRAAGLSAPGQFSACPYASVRCD